MVNGMNICCIGREFVGGEVVTLPLDSPQTLLDFDVAIIDLDGWNIGHISGSPHTLFALDRRRREILDFLALGRTVVVFLGEFPLEAILPVKGVNPISSSGQRMDFVKNGPEHLKTFWATIQKWMTYLVYLDNTIGLPFLFVSETNRPVASWIKHDRGHLLLLPWLTWNRNPYVDTQNYSNLCSQFLRALTTLIKKLTPPKMEFSLPAWSSQYGWQCEKELREHFISLQKQAAELEKILETKFQELEAEDKLKILFTAKGDVLAGSVIETFRELGAKAEPGEPGRDDIIIEFEGKHAVVEVKGRNGSAAEKDVAQLQKWVSISLADREIDAKGILLVNAFCDTPVVERLKQAFPDQMLKLTKKYEHCLLTTTQLLGLLLEARAHPEKRAELVNSLFSTIGVYQQFSDWRSFLTAPVAASAKS